MSETPRSPLAQRLGFYGIDPKDSDFASIAKALDLYADKALDKFYERVAATPETAKFFSNKAAMDRAHRAQAKHWQKVFANGITDTYFEATKVVGDVHARIGLEPKWYVGGYANILQQVITGILSKGSFGFGGRNRTNARMISTLVKVALLDMDIAITRYFEVEEEKRGKVISAIGKALVRYLGWGSDHLSATPAQGIRADRTRLPQCAGPSVRNLRQHSGRLRPDRFHRHRNPRRLR